jgi:hypothetical protein
MSGELIAQVATAVLAAVLAPVTLALAVLAELLALIGGAS